MKFNLVNNKEQALYLWALFFSVALCFSVAVRSFALQCVLVLGCILIIVFIVILFPQASSVLSFPYLQCVHSVANSCYSKGQVFSNSKRSAHYMCNLAVVLLCGQRSIYVVSGWCRFCLGFAKERDKCINFI